MGRQLLERHLQRIQLCTCRSHCQQPKRLRLRHTFWMFSFWRIKCFNVTGWLIDRIWTYLRCASVYIRILSLTKLRCISNMILHDFETHAGFCQILFMRGFELWVSAKFQIWVVMQESHHLASFEKECKCIEWPNMELCFGKMSDKILKLHRKKRKHGVTVGSCNT